MDRFKSLKRDVHTLDGAIKLCNAAPKGDELPQAPRLDDILVDTVHNRTGIEHDRADAALHIKAHFPPHNGQQ